MALEFLNAAATAGSSIIGSIESLIGGGVTKGSTTKTGSSRVKSFQREQGLVTEQLILEPLAIQQIIRDVLGGADGLAAIFAGEQNAGIFNSSVAANEAGALAARLAGEIAKLTGKTVGTTDIKTKATQKVNQESLTKTKSKKEGILDQIF